MFRVSVFLCILGLTCIDANINISPNQFPISSITTPSTFIVGFQVINGCTGSSTQKLDIHFPQGFTTIMPMKHTGWNLTSAVIGGSTTWTLDASSNVPAQIEDGVFDIFQFLITMPVQAGSLPFSFTQYCASGTTTPSNGNIVVLSTATLGQHVVPSQENVFGELLSNIGIDATNAAVDAANAQNDTANAAADLTNAQNDINNAAADLTNAFNDAANAANDTRNAASDAINAQNDLNNAAADLTNALNDEANAANDTKNAAADATNALNDVNNAAADATNALNDATNAANDTKNAASDAINAQNDATNAQTDATNAQNDATNAQNDATNAATDATNAAADATNAQNDAANAQQDSANAAGDASAVTQIDQIRDSGFGGGSSGWNRADTIAVIAIIIAGLSFMAMVYMYTKLSQLQQNDAYLRGHISGSRSKDIEMATMIPQSNKRSIITTVNSTDSDQHELALMSSSNSAYPRETRIHIPTQQQHQRSSSDGTYLTAPASDVNFHD